MLEEGGLVIIESPNFFHGKKLAVYLEPCEIHEDGCEQCYLTDKSAPIKKVCVNPRIKGNSLVVVGE